MIPVISSPTRSWYSSNIMSRSASRIRCRITCLAVWAAIRPKSSGRDVAGLDLVLVGREQLRVELGLLGLAQLARLGVDRSAPAPRSPREQLLLELGRQDQLEDAEVGGVAVEVDAGVLGGARASSCRRTAGRPRARPSACRPRCPSPARGTLMASTISWVIALHLRSSSGHRFERRMRVERDLDRRRRRRRARRASSSAPISSPVKLRWPSIASRGAHATRAAEEAAEVLGLGQRALRPRARRPRAT